MSYINQTHDPDLNSWVDSANGVGTDFPIQNLPFACFRRRNSGETFRGGVAIGKQVLDMAAVAEAGIFKDLAQEATLSCAQDKLNDFMAMGKAAWSTLRLALSQGLRVGAAEQGALEKCLVPQQDVEYALPCHIGDYTDFYTSIYHATAVGSLFRPDNPLLPNYKWVPIGYHGRASSIAVSEQAFRRPMGQVKPPDAEAPEVKPCQRLDYEVEMGIYIGKGNYLGEAISIDKAEDHVFGMCLLNDWSARDIQAWEYQPLGPFLAKSFASTVSPWIVTTEALAPFRLPFVRDQQDPQPLPYLSSEANSKAGSFNITLDCFLQTEQSRRDGEAAFLLSTSNFKYSYWTVGQMVAHHTVNGCNLQAGDLLGSGTQSGPDPSQAGSMLELSGGGKHPIMLPNGENRTFLQDGDIVTMKGRCETGDGSRTTKPIGFGEVVSKVLPC